ncbi:MAG: alpha/beta hydrolase [Steroidobacteraceae bacterium]
MPRPPRPERLLIAGPAGALEALVETPEGSGARGFGVVCHPHPLHGGTLDNKVVHTLARALHDAGMPTLRFNFRGVGASGGQFADGIGETDDALSVVAFGRTRWPGKEPWLLGFSFGAVVAIRAAVPAGAQRLVTVAPAVSRVAAGHATPLCPWLLIQGDADEVIDAGAVLDWASRQTPPPKVHVLREAGHFFHGRLPELREAVVEFAEEGGARGAPPS